ncbi:GDYXXLXY domain-containing protein [Lacinutrix algicola]|uniref:GDYXXLXY domain-containing protein n=1 Tax=Lacinutrix algicola TaxID=342954 RepID=UPI0006E2D1AB|nr:GDYXXLXY domain-containing protein [Lacinutrix algicola]
MKLKYIFTLFILVVIAQLFVPMQMIFGQEAVLNNGKAYKFRTQPVDPSDPYRGKYITLRYDINAAVSVDSTWERKQDIYVYFEEDSLGFAKLTEVSKAPLVNAKDYVKTQVNWYNKYDSNVTFNLPFNRFYMEENKAKPAEDAFRIAQRDTLPNNTYALVYVKDGEAVLKDVIINEISIADYVEEK